MASYLSLNEFKQQMSIDHSHHDGFCNSLLSTAEGYLGDVENGILGRPVVVTEFTEYFDGFSDINLCHPYDVTNVTVTYVDGAGDAQTLPSIFTVRGGNLVLNNGETWPTSANDVSVVYSAGWATVPRPIIDAAYFYAGSLYENRHSEESSPDKLRKMVAQMVRGYRRIGI